MLGKTAFGPINRPSGHLDGDTAVEGAVSKRPQHDMILRVLERTWWGIVGTKEVLHAMPCYFGEQPFRQGASIWMQLTRRNRWVANNIYTS